MLHLLPNVLYSKRSERKSFLQKLFVFVLSLHILFFSIPALIACITKKHDKFTISMRQAGATYVLMPLQKNVAQNNLNVVQSHSDISQKSQVVGYEEYLKTKKNKKRLSSTSTKAAETLAKKEQKIESIKKTKSKSTAILADKRFTKKHLTNKKVSSKVKNKKNIPSKKQQKNKVKIVEQKQNNAVETKKISEAIQEQPKIEDDSLKNDQLQQDTLVASQETLSPISDNVIFVGYEQLDECVIGSKIQHAIVQNWMPPVGLESGISCEVKIAVSLEGTSNSIEVIRGSGILMFDISARSALEEIEFPQEVHGKTIMLVLAN